MNNTLRIGKVAGIEIRAHWSLLPIAWLIMLGLAADILPSLAPDHPVMAYWGMSLLIVVLFYASLLAHELAHSLVAQRHDIEVKRITLWLFGGVSELGSDSRSGVDELVMAIVGPATSLVLGVGFVGLAVVADLAGAFSLLTVSLAWLGLVNIVLGVFNLLPAFPLDGGRVLRAILWEWHDDEAAATRQAGAVSKYIGFGLVGLGTFVFLAGGGISGLWFAILGWFVINAARNQTQQVLARHALEGISVRQLMSPNPTVVPSDLTVSELVDRFVLGHQFSSYPVVDRAGRPVGLVTLDAIRRVPPPRRATARLADVMVALADVVVMPPDAPVTDQLDRLLTSETGRALVLDDHHLVGILSLSDVARAVDRFALQHGGAGLR